MRYICGGLAAACLISLSGVALAEDFVNAETDPRSLLVRDAEIARAKAAEGKGEDVQAEAPKAKSATRAAKVEAAKAEADKTETRASRALAAPAGSEGIKAIVARHAAANGVPFSLADAVVRVESRYNPRASHAGNYGLMQIRHQTARGMGYSGGAGGLLDAETNARFGMKYLAQAYKLAGGDTCRTIMKYQSGHMATRMSGANRTYCAKVRTITARN
ncbi:MULTISPECIES: lytic transglycosylase domain-containing protein [Bosea]|uniref:lytic transglycosylase domain-containing protein n=1 Tax=Bosea TaxID=85413 RepID=UPI002150086E|nr:MULTISPECIES: transglycosylase SLT domain-containing protein [Bosea]MCR4523340.1 transglycosylase SLT domain-containing protein [Bosea sp. 47.2.35]MDR6828587.1 soluble lytic murein transglycosylase-like protein [Bosea robiniae]MDR6895246.1 soluble lytic murein transglycosylase-like protein [Bosea sp. BE109]MDR7138642.1 soluble lytic murein transglycosylase-like protein [Bosea sp. BE168]MDR7175383.1 soluble lytic murein transglycosylase-like protein [Bosea sp. BE271]